MMSRIILTVLAVFLLFMGVMTQVSVNAYENGKPLVKLGFTEPMELYNTKGEVIPFKHSLPGGVIYQRDEEGLNFIFTVREIEGLWGQKEFIATETLVYPTWHYELPFAVFPFEPEPDFVNYPIVFSSDKSIYDGTKVRIR
jgi:hypothetical protein